MSSPYTDTGALALADGRAYLADPNSVSVEPRSVKSRLLKCALIVLRNGVPQLVAAIEEGRISVTRAAKVAELDVETQIKEAEAAFFEHNRFRSRLRGRGAIVEITDPTPPVDWKKSRTYALQSARCAITQLEPIPRGNESREEAFDIVVEWINNQRKRKKR